MDELIRQLSAAPDAATAPTLVQVLLAIALSFGLSLVVAYTYRITHTGPSYSQASVHTMVLMAAVTSVIMLIIGSNIARAFSLVGALSVIRFRSAIKDPRDVAFLYFAMAIGMGAGTRFYGAAVVLTFAVCGIAFFLHRFDVGAKPMNEALLRLIVAEGSDVEAVLGAALQGQVDRFVLLGATVVAAGKVELTYAIELAAGASDPALLAAVGGIEGVERPEVLRGLHGVHVNA